MSNNRFDLLSHNVFGYDRLIDYMFDLVDGTMKPTSTFPFYNVYKKDDGEFTIEIALAGYTKDQIKIEHDKHNHKLNISSTVAEKREDTKGNIISRGISTKQFVRSFTLSEDIYVDSAEMENGLLTIKLKTLVPEEAQPILIPLK